MVQGVIFIVLGFWLCRRPPVSTPSVWFDLAIMGFLLVVLTGFLPIDSFHRPNWWKRAVEDFNIVFPVTWSVQPLLTLEASLRFLGALAWLYLVWNMPSTHQTRKQILYLFVFIVTILAVISIAGNLLGYSYFWGQGVHCFSYFPNRNQTANFFCLAAILSFGLVLHHLSDRKGWAIGMAFATILLFVAIVVTLSRAAVILFFLAATLIVILHFRNRSFSFCLKLSIPFILILVSFLFFYGGSNLSRYKSLFSNGPGTSFRWHLFCDSMHFVADQPLLGVGLGNFQYIFPQYREASVSYQKVIHPESDWIWVLGEMGVGGLFFSVLGTAILLGVFFTFFEKTSCYRTLAGLCVFVFLFHSMVDVPGHRYGTVFTVIFLYRLALPSRAGTRTLIASWVFRLFGLLLLMSGFLWVIAFAFDLPYHSTVIKERAERKGALDTGIQWLPMKWELYYQRACHNLPGKREEALSNFRRVRFLEPLSALVSYREGVEWLSYDSTLAFAAWRDALSRQTDNEGGLRYAIMRASGRNPAFAPYLEALSRNSVAFRYEYLQTLRGEVFLAALEEQLKEKPPLGKFSALQREGLLRHYLECGGAARYLDLVKEHPDWPEYLKAVALAKLERYKEAIILVRVDLEGPSIPLRFTMKTKEELQQDFILAPNDILLGVSLFKLQMEGEEWKKALGTLQSLFHHNNQMPPYFYAWKGEVLFQLHRYRESWHEWDKYFALLHESSCKLGD